MTPKDKAKELFTEFSGNTVHHDAAKQCTLKCVDEIIKSYPHTYDIEKEYTRDGDEITVITNIRANMEYWNQVKQEIEKL